MTPILALAGPLPKVGAVVAVLLAAAALLTRDPRRRALAMAAALVLAPVLLVADISDSPQLEAMRDRPLVAAAVAAAGLAVVVALAALMARRPLALPLLVLAALPFRIPIEVAGETANLLVPLYAVIAAGTLATVVPALRGPKDADTYFDFGGGGGGAPDAMTADATGTAGDRERASAAGAGAGADADDGDADAARWQPGWLERLLALTVALYGIQATYSDDFDKALQQIAFFVVPFALLFVLLARTRWTPRMLRLCFGLLVGLALAFSVVGYVEYATRHIFLNPKLIASNSLHTYFRTNSVFFDPNIYGRFLAIAMIAVAAVMLASSRARAAWAGAAALAALWAGLVLTLSQSSLAALLVGLVTLAALRWGARRVVAPLVALAAVAAAVLLATPGTFGVDLDNLDASTSGRAGLVGGGAELFAQRPILGHGSGAFSVAYRRHERRLSPEAPTTSHTIPVTVAAEQGAVGLIAYLALLAAALARLLGRAARTSVARTAVAAAFVALLLHTLVYAAFLEDPLTWALLGVGTALAAAAPRRAPAAAPAAGASTDVVSAAPG